MNSNISDRLVLVTGATDGIGKQTALDLAEMGARVIVHGRSREIGDETAAELMAGTGNDRIDSVAADFGSLAEVRNMAGKIHEDYEKIDVLINNAGIYKTHRERSADGYELTFAVNHLAHFLLTGLLLDMIEKSDYARIINVASQAHAGMLDFDNLQAEHHFSGYDAYSRSKLCNILFTYKLARKLGESDITANVLHPGVIITKLLHTGFGSGGASVERGAKTSVYLAVSDEVKGVSGKYFVHSQIRSSASVSYNTQVQDKLWELSSEMVDFQF